MSSPRRITPAEYILLMTGIAFFMAGVMPMIIDRELEPLGVIFVLLGAFLVALYVILVQKKRND